VLDTKSPKYLEMAQGHISLSEVTDVALEPDLTYLEHPIRVLDQKDMIT
jgi:hypothetical protein